MKIRISDIELVLFAAAISFIDYRVELVLMTLAFLVIWAGIDDFVENCDNDFEVFSISRHITDVVLGFHFITVVIWSLGAMVYALFKYFL